MRQRVESETKFKSKFISSDTSTGKTFKTSGSSTPTRKLSGNLGSGLGTEISKAVTHTSSKDRSHRRSQSDLKLGTLTKIEAQVDKTDEDEPQHLQSTHRLQRIRSDLSDLISTRFDMVGIDGSPSSSSPTYPSIYPSISSLPSSTTFPSYTYSPSTSPSSFSFSRGISTEDHYSYSSLTSSFENLSCQEQETKIMFLRQCLSSLGTIENSLLTKEEGKHTTNTSSTNGNDGNDNAESSNSLSHQSLMEMFKKAVEALDETEHSLAS